MNNVDEVMALLKQLERLCLQMEESIITLKKKVAFLEKAKKPRKKKDSKD